MKKFFIESRMLGKSLSLTLILLLAVNCQTDESADIGLKENLPTEGIGTQSQARAREILESKEYLNFTNQNRLFISKIHDGDFLSEEFINDEKETYNYDLIRERLPMTSFESAQEFVREYEKAFYCAQKLVIKYPYFSDPSIQNKINEEIMKKRKESFQVGSIWCEQHCRDDFYWCKGDAETVCGITIAACACVLVTGAVPAGCACVFAAYGIQTITINACERTKYKCIRRCNGY